MLEIFTTIIGFLTTISLATVFIYYVLGWKRPSNFWINLFISSLGGIAAPFVLNLLPKSWQIYFLPRLFLFLFLVLIFSVGILFSIHKFYTQQENV